MCGSSLMRKIRTEAVLNSLSFFLMVHVFMPFFPFLMIFLILLFLGIGVCFFGLDNHSICTLERTPLCSPLYISCPFSLQLCYLAASFMQWYISLLTPLVAALLTYSCKMLAYCVLLCITLLNILMYMLLCILYICHWLQYLCKLIFQFKTN